MSPESPLHANTTSKVFEYFYTLFRNVADVRQTHPITLSNSEPEPDIVLAQLPKTRYNNIHPYPQDIYLVLEISAATLDYDLKIKKSIYAKDEIQEYWVIALKNRKLIRFKDSEQGEYRQEFEDSTGTVTIEAFPNMKIDLDRLFL